jgi:3-oxoacyl-[acyl-carrier-protein] synthase II
MPKPPRVLITGVGLVTPLGADRESSWQGLLAGELGCRTMHSDSPGWPDPSAGAPVAPPNLDLQVEPPTAFLLSEPTIALAVAAALEASRHAGLEHARLASDRAACVIGTSKGGVVMWEREAIPHLRAASELAPSEAAWWSCLAPNGAASAVASLFNLQGGSLAPVTACATGLSSIIRGADLIRHGECDVVLAGSSDASLTPAVLASFRKLGVLADRNLNPAEAVKPYDRNRTGFLVGAGAGIVVLESEAHAKARGAKPIAEWLTGGMACEASGIAQLEEKPEALTWLIRDVLRRSGVAPGEIDYISLHGTATKANDIAEVRAVKAAFGPDAYKLSASSLKGAIGHLLGAAGSVEFAATLLAMRDSRLPPTMNLTDPDDECDLDFVAGKSKPREIAHAMKLSLGFGGHLVAGVIRKL